MSHEIEIIDGVGQAFFSNNQPAWHGLGTVIPQDVVTTDEAIVLAGLDWEVHKLPFRPQVILPNGETVLLDEPEREYVNVRSSDGKVLGTVGDRYKVFNNRDAFAFGDTLVDSHEAKWHTAGVLHGGRKTWMLMKLPQDVLIAGEETERVEPYICFQNSHDGSSAVKAFITPVRVVCQNTLSWALNGTRRKIEIRHTGNLERYIVQAQEALGLTFDLLAQMEREGAQMMTTAFTTANFEQMMKALMPEPDSADDSKSGKRAYTMWENRFDEYMQYFLHSPNIDNVRHTQWGALQAVSEVADHRMRQRGQVNDPRENRFIRLLDGEAIVQQAHDYLVAV